MSRSQPNPNIVRIAATYQVVLGTVRETIREHPDLRFVARACMDSLREGALVSTDTLAVLQKMDKYERLGTRPQEALNRALGEEN